MVSCAKFIELLPFLSEFLENSKGISHSTSSITSLVLSLPRYIGKVTRFNDFNETPFLNQKRPWLSSEAMDFLSLQEKYSIYDYHTRDSIMCTILPYCVPERDSILCIAHSMNPSTIYDHAPNCFFQQRRRRSNFVSQVDNVVVQLWAFIFTLSALSRSTRPELFSTALI